MSSIIVHSLLGQIELPWEQGVRLLCTGAYGQKGSRYHCDDYNSYYALDFDRVWEGNIEPETKILSITEGVVKSLILDPSNILGLHVEIMHRGGITSLYAHLKEVSSGIFLGKKVKRGAFIGFLGETGQADGPHLHFQLLKNGRCHQKDIETKPEPMSGYKDFTVGYWYESRNNPIIF